MAMSMVIFVFEAIFNLVRLRNNHLKYSLGNEETVENAADWLYCPMRHFQNKSCGLSKKGRQQLGKTEPENRRLT